MKFSIDENKDIPEFLEWLDLPPIETEEELMAFDRGMCALGIKRFLRRTDMLDVPKSMRKNFVIKNNECTLVEEIKPGVRFRKSVIGFKMAKG